MGPAEITSGRVNVHLRNLIKLGGSPRNPLSVFLTDTERDALAEVELICNAAVIPPVFNLQGWDGRPVIDGGMVNAAPMPEPDEGETLVLLTRSYRNLPRHPAKTWIEPSDETPADKLDFTDPSKLRRTWELGREDGKRFLEQLAIDPD